MPKKNLRGFCAVYDSYKFGKNPINGSWEPANTSFFALHVIWHVKSNCDLENQVKVTKT